MANLHCEFQELKPKVETNSPFLVLHPSSGVDTVNTVGSHLNRSDKDLLFFLQYWYLTSGNWGKEIKEESWNDVSTIWSESERKK